jgi:hypothetical protein
VTKQATLPGQSGRPSIETGFHALLGTFVLHSHSAYAGIIACAENADELLGEILPEAVLVPFSPPGYYLTLNVAEALGTHPGAKILLLKSHGLIVSADSAESAIKLEEEVDRRIKDHFRLTADYPVPVIAGAGELWQSRTPFLTEFLSDHRSFDPARHILFPDQTVFCADPRRIETAGGQIAYRASGSEAKTIEEILVAWAFILSKQEKAGLKPDFITRTDTDFISQMESEKYRQALAK